MHARSATTLLLLGQLGCADAGLAKTSATAQDERDAAADDVPLEGALSEELFIEELCRKATPCCAAAGVENSTSACHAKFERLRASSYFDAARARACLLRLRAMSFADAACPDQPLVPFCSDIFFARGGQTASGESCAWDQSECAAAPGQRAVCDSSTQRELSEKLARCHLLAPSALGESCDASTYTDASGTTQLSITRSFEDVDAVFRDGHYCDAADGLRCDDRSHVCVSLAAPDEPRALGAFCSRYDPNPCDTDAYCAADTQRCEPKGDLGDACLPFNPHGCRSTFCNGGRCAPAFGGLKLELVCGPAAAASGS